MGAEREDFMQVATHDVASFGQQKLALQKQIFVNYVTTLVLLQLFEHLSEKYAVLLVAQQLF